VTGIREGGNECTWHNFSLFAIFLPKIIKIGGNLKKFWQKQFCIFLRHGVCFCNSSLLLIPCTHTVVRTMIQVNGKCTVSFYLHKAQTPYSHHQNLYWQSDHGHLAHSKTLSRLLFLLYTTTHSWLCIVAIYSTIFHFHYFLLITWLFQQPRCLWWLWCKYVKWHSSTQGQAFSGP